MINKGLWKVIKRQEEKDGELKPRRQFLSPKFSFKQDESFSNILSKVHKKDLSKGTTKEETPEEMSSSRYQFNKSYSKVKQEQAKSIPKQKIKMKFYYIRKNLRDLKDFQNKIILQVEEQKQLWMQRMRFLVQALYRGIWEEVKHEEREKSILKEEVTRNLERTLKAKEQKIKELQFEKAKKEKQIYQIKIKNQQINSLLNDEERNKKAILDENLELKEIINQYSNHIQRIQSSQSQDYEFFAKKYENENKNFYVGEIQRLEEEVMIIGQKHCETQEQMRTKEKELNEKEEEIERKLKKMYQNIEQLYEQFEKVRIKEEEILMRERLLSKEQQKLELLKIQYENQIFYNPHQTLNASQLQPNNLNNRKVSPTLHLVKSFDPQQFRKNAQRNYNFNMNKKYEMQKNKSFATEVDWSMRRELKKRKSKDHSLIWKKDESLSVKNKLKVSEEKFRYIGLTLQKLKIDIKNEIKSSK